MLETADGLQLQEYEWSASKPVLTLILIHGFGEHAGRYQEFAQFLNQHHISVVAADLRGHGRTKGKRGHLNRFEDYHLDVEAMLKRARLKSSGLPIALFGHSMGGLIALSWALCHDRSDIAAMTVTSPLLGLSAPGLDWLRPVIQWISRIAPDLSLPVRLKGEDVCRDPERRQQYGTDPLNHSRASCRWLSEVLDAAQCVRQQGHRMTLPTLLLYAEADRVVAAQHTADFAKTLPSSLAHTEGFPEAAHELLNEPPQVRTELMNQLAEWLLRHASDTTCSDRTPP